MDEPQTSPAAASAAQTARRNVDHLSVSAVMLVMICAGMATDLGRGLAVGGAPFHVR